jgi:tight adherence protein B
MLVFAGIFGGRRGGNPLDRYSAAPQPAQVAKKPRANLGDLISGSGALSSVNRVIEGRDWGASLARDLARADLVLKPSEFLAIRFGVLVGIPLALIALSPVVEAFTNPLVWIIGLVVGFWVPRFWLNRRKGKRLKAFNKNLADTITLVANGLRAGASFLQAIEMVVRETQPPISTEFARVIREVNLGLPLDEALGNMTRRVRSDDLELMTTAIAIHHTVGGNLAEILDSIAFTIRERVRIKGEIRTLTAQQRMSGYVVGFLPIALVGMLTLIAPHFMDPMLQKPPELLGLPAGMIILGFGGFMMLIGFVIIRRIVDIEV